MMVLWEVNTFESYGTLIFSAVRSEPTLSSCLRSVEHLMALEAQAV
ncbi:MAG: hypothetical protein ACI89J_004448 [Hyphomicrobiaceae bacterium]|jgi:hypothetical protein